MRAAEAVARRAAPAGPPPGPDPALAGVRFLAEQALRSSRLPVPVPPEGSDELLDAFGAQGLEPEEVLAVLPDLPLTDATATRIAARIAGGGAPG